MKHQGKQARSKETIQTILAAAGKVLVDHGYEKATTNRIAERSGYGVGTLYRYFDNKEDIFAQLVDEAIAGLLDAASDYPVQDTLENSLMHLLNRVAQAMQHDPSLIQAVETLMVGQFRDKREVALESLVGLISGLLEAHRDEIAVDDLTLAARVIVLATEGLANDRNLGPLNHEELVTQALRLQVAYLTMGR